MDYSAFTFLKYETLLKLQTKLGKKLAGFVRDDIGYYTPVENVFFVGFSIGAQIAGTGGALLNGRVGAIYG